MSTECSMSTESLPSAEVVLGEIIQRLKTNLKKIQSQKVEMENSLLNGVDEVKEHCLELRISVDLATEIAHRDINLHRDELLKEIADYENKTAVHVHIEEEKREEFTNVIGELKGYTEMANGQLDKEVGIVDQNEVLKKDSLCFYTVEALETSFFVDIFDF